MTTLVEKQIQTLLTPSETAFFLGHEFSRTVHRLDVTGFKVAPPDGDDMVSGAELWVALLAIAFLANEKTSRIELDPFEWRGWGGLGRHPALYVRYSPDRAPQGDPWPSATLEATVCSLAGSLAATGPRRVSDIVFHLLMDGHSHPLRRPVGIVARGLVERGILKATDHRRMVVFKRRVFTVQQSTALEAAATNVPGVHGLIARAKQERKDAWDGLLAEIRLGMHSSLAAWVTTV